MAQPIPSISPPRLRRIRDVRTIQIKRGGPCPEYSVIGARPQPAPTHEGDETTRDQAECQV